MTCDEVWALMTAKPDPTQCTNAEVAAVVKHVATCPPCHARYRQAKAEHDAVHGPTSHPDSAAKIAACKLDPEALGPPAA